MPSGGLSFGSGSSCLPITFNSSSNIEYFGNIYPCVLSKVFDSKSLRTDSVIGEFKVAFSYLLLCIHYILAWLSIAVTGHCFLVSLLMTAVLPFYLLFVGHTDLFSHAQLIIIMTLSFVVFSLSWMLAWCIMNTVSTADSCDTWLHACA